MEVTLIRNGYNLQRRKMYLQNPRHNLRSSVQLLWQQSLTPHPNQIQTKKQISTQLIKNNYTKAIDRRLEEELKLNKSSFRVMMAPDSNQMKSTMTSRNRSQDKNGYYDSLNRQMNYMNEQKNTLQFESPPPRGYQKSHSVSKSVFGYEIDRNAFQNESYLSKILSNRLQPYLNKQQKNKGSGGRHQSFTINHPISLKY